MQYNIKSQGERLNTIINSNFKKVIKSSIEKYSCYNYRGKVINVGDGIANVAGLYKIQLSIDAQTCPTPSGSRTQPEFTRNEN